MRLTCNVFMLAVLAGSPGLAADKPDRQGLDFFESKIRPVLVRHCYQCHSAKAVAAKTLKGGLQLDTRDGARKGGESGPAVVPGKPGQSLLISALKHETVKMPPKAKLPDAIIADFVKWISIGAPDPREGKSVTGATIDLVAGRKHWAFQPLADVKPPAVKDAGWVRTPIDQFIRARQEAAGVTPNGPADLGTLLRRLHFDLVGLPPAEAELDRFTAEAAEDLPAAWNRLVDRLLAGQHYGERWGRHWLDLVRFAESNGYAFDKDRPNAWHYRDFVIRAFNRDMPYDQFVRLQLTGDLLADTGTKTNQEAQRAAELIAATGFLVSGPFTSQQTQKERERSRYEQLDDMVHTLGTSLLGLTLGCARCHSHKYDPLPQQDYYRLVSCFKEVGYADTGINLEPEAFRKVKSRYDAAHAALTGVRSDFEREQLPGRFTAWLANRPKVPPAPKLGAWHHAGPFPGADFNKAFDQVFPPETKIYLGQTFQGGKVKWIEQPGWTDGKVHNTLKGENAANYLYRVIDAAGPQVLALSLGSDDGIKAWINGKQVLAKKATRGAAADQEKVQVPLLKGTNVLLIKIVNAGGVSGFYFKSSNGSPPKAVAELLKTGPTKWDDKQRKQVRDWYRTLDADWVKANNAIEDHKKKEPKPKLTPVFAAKVRGATYQFGADTFKVYYLGRGNADNKQGEAPPGFLQVLTNGKLGDSKWLVSAEPAAKGGRPARIAAADWLTDVDHGAGVLLARVIVNRLWHHHFGRGLVATPNDFGTRGERPSHPQLLDWLAGQLIRGGWRLKPIHRLIVTSSVYMQAGGDSADADDRDPDNRLWWRKPSRRLEAEIIRDALLAVGGTLDLTPFGKGSLDQKSTRRSVYLTVKRGQLIPFLQLFDAPDAMQGTGSRLESTVAPQALALLNSPFLRDLAGVFARKIRADDKMSLDDVVTTAYRVALSRSPDSDERTTMVDFIKAQATSRGDKGDAVALAVRDFCHLLLCSNEFIYVD